jgi:prepilin-type N-terminal cleavage/methylation domain-containing protein
MRRKNGFTLIEIMVSLVVFAMVMAAMGSAFYKTFKDWQRQRNYDLAMDNARWAVEFMSNEIRLAHGASFISHSGESGLNDHELVKFLFDPTAGGGPPNSKVYYWRGKTGVGQPYVLFRSLISAATAFDPADVASRQELSRFVVNNTDIFNVSNCPGNCSVEMNLTVRPRPDLAVGPGNQNYTFRTTVRPRN